jgi:diketogulonate reductase-like aldo/keto reductase
LVNFLLAKEILPIAYTPVARPGAVEKGDKLCPADWPDLRNDEYLQSLGTKYGKSVVQIMLNFGVSRGYAVIPKANGLDHQKENMEIFDFKLSPEEITQICLLDKRIRLCNKFSMTENFDVFA